MAKTHILHVAVDKATDRELRAIAKQADLSLSDILRKAVSIYLAWRTEQNPLRNAIEENKRILAAQPKEQVPA